MELNSTHSIVGVTGSGKTAFALRIAAQLLAEQAFDHVALISADSRQVYKGLEILSGADIPENYVQAKTTASYSYFTSAQKSISVHGQSVVAPSTHWSLAHFKELVANVQSLFANTRTAFLIVGGTGLYHRWLYQDTAWQSVVPDVTLRQELAHASVAELQARLRTESPEWFAALNHSDQYNPRRLQRAIERAQAGITPENRQQQTHSASWIGLADDSNTRAERIRNRVLQRLQSGAIQEVENLLREFPDMQLPAWSTIGVPQVLQFLRAEITEEELLAAWTLAEVQYCKRQQTWFKREPIVWISPGDKDDFQVVFQQLTQANNPPAP